MTITSANLTRSAMTIRWHLRRVMAEKRMTNRALGEAIGMHEGSISRLKNQDEMPYVNSELLSALCKALEVSPDDLLEYCDES